MDINQEFMAQQQLRNSMIDRKQALEEKKQELLEKQEPRKKIEEEIGGPLLGEAMNRILKNEYMKKGLSKVGVTSEDLEKLGDIIKSKNKEDLLKFVKDKGQNTLNDLKNDLKQKVNNLVPNIQNKVKQATKEDNIHVKRLKTAQDLDERYDKLTREGKAQVDNATKAYEPIVENNQADVEKNFDALAGIRENVISKMEDSGETKTIVSQLPEIDDPNSVFDGLDDIKPASLPSINNLPKVQSVLTSPDNKISIDGLDDIQKEASNKLSSVVSKGEDLLSDVKSGAEKAGKGLLEGLGEAGSEGFIDPITDAVGLVTGLGSVLDSIFDTKKVNVPTPLQVTSSYTPGVL